jgi:DNA processing protein
MQSSALHNAFIEEAPAGLAGFGCSPEEVLALRLTPGAGPVRIHTLLALLRQLGLPLRPLLGRDLAALLRLLPPGAQALAALLAECAAPKLRMAARILAVAREHGGEALAPGMAAYPAALGAHLGRGAPPLLFAYGSLALLARPGAAVVGTRCPSVAGVGFAREAAQCFAAQAVVLISGGAQGIDTAAHHQALEAGGATVVVLPQGLSTYLLPACFRRAIEEGRCLLLSECLPSAGWQAHAAVARNRIIAALGQVVCVIEPRKLGGSIVTARHGLSQGKPVFVAGAEPAVAAGLAARGAHIRANRSEIQRCASSLAAWREDAAAPRQAELPF